MFAGCQIQCFIHIPLRPHSHDKYFQPWQKNLAAVILKVDDSCRSWVCTKQWQAYSDHSCPPVFGCNRTTSDCLWLGTDNQVCQVQCRALCKHAACLHFSACNTGKSIQNVHSCYAIERKKKGINKCPVFCSETYIKTHIRVCLCMHALCFMRFFCMHFLNKP